MISAGKPTAQKLLMRLLQFSVVMHVSLHLKSATTGDIRIITEIAQALGTQECLVVKLLILNLKARWLPGKLLNISINKTAALICSSIQSDNACKCPQITIDKLTAYGNHIGLAFQVVDDILDEVSTTEQLGKDAGSDRANGKATFPAVCGMDESKRYARELVEKAWNEITFLESKGGFYINSRST